jgi:hypothetical protein
MILLSFNANSNILKVFTLSKLLEIFSYGVTVSGFKFASVLCIVNRTAKFCDLGMVIFETRGMLYKQFCEQNFHVN